MFDRYNIVSDGDLKTASRQLGGLMTGTIQGQSTADAATAESKTSNLEDARMVMSPSQAIAVARATNSTTLLATGGSLFGVPVTTTAAITNKILLFDASQVVYGDDPAGVRIDLARHATLEFDSAPSCLHGHSGLLRASSRRRIGKAQPIDERWSDIGDGPGPSLMGRARSSCIGDRLEP